LCVLLRLQLHQELLVALVRLEALLSELPRLAEELRLEAEERPLLFDALGLGSGSRLALALKELRQRLLDLGGASDACRLLGLLDRCLALLAQGLG